MAYSALNSYLSPLIAQLNGTTNIDGETFRSKFKSYYNARQDLLNAITTKAKALADAAQSSATENGQQITVMSQQLTTLTSELGTTKSQVTQNSQTIATINADGGSAYKAQWGVKATVGDITAGIGLTVKKETGKPDVAQCTVIAGQFSVGVASITGAATVYPFIVANHPTTGIPGVFIDTAYIKAANVQDLVAGEVVADNIKVGATLTAPYIKGGRIEIGSIFTVNENGNMVANNATLSNATVSGIINANGGIFNNVTIQENCDVKGTVYANKIVGDIYRAISIHVPKRTDIFGLTLVANGVFESQNYARRLQFPSLSIYGYGYATAYYYVNNAVVASQQFTISDNIVGTERSNAYPRAGVNTPSYVHTMPPNVSGTFEIRLEINRRRGGNVERISEVYDQVVVFGLFKVQQMNIRDRISELQEQALFINDPDFVSEAIKLFDNGRIHLFDFGDRFTLLMPRDYDDVPCVHVYFACTNKKTFFADNYKFVAERAAEIGAKYLTFSTANKSVERLALRHGWAKLSQGPILSEWIIEL